jgi:drug/metabolite transporter (DMT)-like permease
VIVVLLVALVVIPGTAGDLLNAAGMKRHGEITDWSAHALLRLGLQLARDPYIVLGIPAMAVSFFALMALLSKTTLSLSIPLTASSYILDTVLARYLLGEDVNWRRWAGALLVAIGIGLLSI